jgi:hypothetical protein
MPLLDTLLVLSIVLFLIFLIWSKAMGQTMLDTFKELVGMFRELGEVE